MLIIMNNNVKLVREWISLATEMHIFVYCDNQSQCQCTQRIEQMLDVNPLRWNDARREFFVPLQY